MEGVLTGRVGIIEGNTFEAVDAGLSCWNIKYRFFYWLCKGFFGNSPGFFLTSFPFSLKSWEQHLDNGPETLHSPAAKAFEYLAKNFFFAC